MRAQMLLVLWILIPVPAFAAAFKVAVLEFANGSASSEWAPLGKGLQEMFLVDLDKAEAVEVVARSDLRARQLAMNLSPPGEVAVRQKLAKEAGATHILSGSFTVEGPTMDLRIELLDAGTGKVLLADRETGDAEAFFELQKAALQASIGALKLNLTPKERADTGRIHTADFTAFQDFSRGIDHFDAERYEASLQSLRAASARDAEFGLARITLQQYEELIARTRTKAEAVRTVQAEQARLAKLQAAGEEVEVVRRLLEIASREGPQSQRARLTALHTLAVAYGNLGTNRGKLSNLRAIDDRFAMARSSDQLAAQYHQEALPLWPKLPLQVEEDNYGGFPALATFDKDFEWNAKKLWDYGLDYPENRKNMLIDNLRYPHYLAEQLRLSYLDEVKLRERFARLAREQGAEGYSLEEQSENLVKAYRLALMLDEATRILDAKARVTENEWALKGLAEQMEEHKALATFLERAPNPTLAREYAMLALADGWQLEQTARFGTQSLFVGNKLTPKGASQVTRFREMPDRTYTIIGDTPVWIHQPMYWLYTGPRSDARVAQSIRYNREDGSTDNLDALLFVGGAPYADLQARLTLSHEIPEDFWPGTEADRKVGQARPMVSFLVGARDLDCAEVRDPVTGKDVLNRPLTAVAVRWTGDAVQIVQVAESERGMWERKARFAETILATKPVKKGAGPVSIDIVVRGDVVRATAAGVTVEAKAAAPVLGFTGLQIRGPGFVEIGGLSLVGAPAGRSER